MNTTDLSSLIQLIDIVTVRGAFRGEELSSVGQLREKLVAAVKETTPEKKPE